MSIRRRRRPLRQRRSVQDLARLRAADQLLTNSLVGCLDGLVDELGETDPFIEVMAEGLMSDACTCHRRPYPPVGHSYPKEG